MPAQVAFKSIDIPESIALLGGLAGAFFIAALCCRSSL